jgi:carbon monoxide dehydrogenase subunit G
MTRHSIALRVVVAFEWPPRHHRMPTDDEAIESLLEQIEQRIRDIPGIDGVTVNEDTGDGT